LELPSRIFRERELPGAADVRGPRRRARDFGDGDVPLSKLAERNERISVPVEWKHKYATFFYAQLEDRGRRLRYVNAGHNPPYLVRGGQTRN